MSPQPLLNPPENCWRIERADEFALLIDADCYFAAARAAMKAAKRSIFLVGWDFDARVTLGHPDVSDEGPRAVGDFLLWLARRNSDLEIRLLLWNPAFLANWAKFSNVPYLLRWKLHPRITVRLDGNHPVGSSHHQKILVVDDSLAFCGGIDVTSDRWDTREHLDNDPRRKRPNGALYGPWHDASSYCIGPAARALGDLCRERWKLAGGEELEPAEWHQAFPRVDGAIAFGAVDLAISRTSPEYDGRQRVTEVERLYVDMIMSARAVIYAESQYFASRIVAQAMARRLAEPDGPEIVLINPVEADNWLGSLAMDTARARLRESMRRHDARNRFRIYHPVTAQGAPVYVHSKLMIVDDRAMRVGSSNFNNRSMRFDNECDVAFEASGSDALAQRLLDLRNDMLAEHLGMGVEEFSAIVERSGSLIGAIEEVRTRPRSGAQPASRTLIPYVTPEISDLAEWLADNEILDPEGPDAVFEPIEKRGLFRGKLRVPSRSRG
ncbi:phosphatidylserine/phosphatidylglycerophosphate/cardiolipin synthase [Rhizobium leguminosarum bv. trifolii WSM2297]|uniref:Phospholipase D n=1 Tax=Rhizobium leguminosarum bv. trifolii WSM2297 TaxID=754762 RepID=J0WB20_RHILT|nr:phospholipase D-like domain-containing protein [Rhizobium leguminosarum]EJC82966.1 phosphatidylserine/phosphatidylglycerophosphate/cardiolipin synthase [Rhizobium leguminosarum bv. trifolii WSM2297]